MAGKRGSKHLPSSKVVDDKAVDLVRLSMDALPHGTSVNKLHLHIRDHHKHFIPGAVIRQCIQRLKQGSEPGPSDAAVQQAPAQVVPQEETPVEKASVQDVANGQSDAAVQQAPAQDAPQEETPVEEAPVEEAPVEEAPVQDVANGFEAALPEDDPWAVGSPNDEVPWGTGAQESAEAEEVQEAEVEELEMANGTLPDLSYLDDEERDALISKGRFDESGRRLLPGDSRKMAMLLFVSHSDGDTFGEFRPSTTYTAENASVVGASFALGPRDLFTFRNQQYGYGRLGIEHAIVYGEGENPRRSTTFATTTFDTSGVKYLKSRTMSKEDYLGYCRARGLTVEDTTQSDVWFVDIIASTSQFYFATQTWGVETLAKQRVPGHIDAIKATTAALQCSAPLIRLHLFFVGHSLEPKATIAVMSTALHTQEDGPYAYLLRHAEGRHRLPSLVHMVNPIDCDFRIPDSAVYRFKDRDELTVRLAYGARDEEAYSGALIALLYKRPQKAFAMDLPIARVRNPFTHKEEATHCVICLPSPTDMDLMPAIGETAKIVTNIPVTFEDAPRSEPTEGELVETLTGIIAEGANMGRLLNVEKERDLSYILAAFDKIVKPSSKEEEPFRINWIRKHATDLKFRPGTESILGENTREHKQRVEDWVRRHLDHLHMHSRDCAEFAEFRATRLSPISGFPNCLLFHAEYPRNKLWHTDPQPHVPVPLPFVPPRLDANPVQTYRDDPKRYGFVATIAREFSEATVEARLAGVSYAAPAVERRPTVQKLFNWILDFDSDVVRYDLAALFPSLRHLQDRIADKTAAESAFYAAAAHQDPKDETGDDRHVFSTQVTFTEEQSDAMLAIYNKLDSYQKAIVSNLHQPFGSFLVSGCPGSGKSYTAGALVMLALMSRVSTASWDALLKSEEEKPDDFKVATASTTEPPPVAVSYDEDITYKDPSDFQHPLDVAWGMAGDADANDWGAVQTENVDEWGNPISTPPGDASDTTPAAQGSDDWNTQHGDAGGPAWPAQEESGEAPVETVSFKAALESEQTEAEAPKATTYQKCWALVLGTQNEQLDVMANNIEKFHAALPFRHPFITRAVTAQTLNHRMGEYERTPEHVKEDDGLPVDEAFETALLLERAHQSAKNFRMEASESRFTVSSQVAVLLAENKLIAARHANQLLHEKHMDPVEFRLGDIYKELREVLRQLVKYVYVRSDFILATPFVANSLVRKLENRPAAVWIDEAWRMAEPDALIGLAGFPEALIRIQSGDAMQLPPFCMSLDAHKTLDKSRWLANQFGAQFVTSMAKRATECGHDVTYLMTNWRATGALSEWASNTCYAGRMAEGVAEDDSPEMKRITEYLRAIKPDLMSKRLVLQISGTEEKPVGTSYTNPIMATVVRELIASIFANRLCSRLPTGTSDGRFADIMVISPYKQQCQLHRERLNDLSDAEWDRSRVVCRTVDSAIGAEADMVIYVNPRTNGVGFTAKKERMNVAHTRARKAEIVLMSDSLTRDNSLQTRHLRDFCKVAAQLNSIVTYKGDRWELCEQCFTKHHGKKYKGCPRVKCAVCDGLHPTRKCRGTADVPTVPAGCELPPIAQDIYTKMFQNEDGRRHAPRGR
ncbi:hypothetical protein SLS62_005549 [Diatrype stigma]|uniref:DNA2/NAM7 helicase-like C-terminal domain-containing protein n=1 Tax=Diatrype stigma TaxID=117547 RepID=A0AAN9USP0_9PEZI